MNCPWLNKLSFIHSFIHAVRHLTNGIEIGHITLLKNPTDVNPLVGHVGHWVARSEEAQSRGNLSTPG